MNSHNVHEKFLYEVWKNQNFDKLLLTKEGEQIVVISPGIENKETGGPDFSNARVRIGNITFLGDVEIDITTTDWKAHGHHLNKKFNRVILHITLTNSSGNHYVFTQEGRKILSFPIDKFIDDSLSENIRRAIQSERKKRLYRMVCSEASKNVNEKDKLDFIFNLGASRFKGKCAKYLERLKELVHVKELITKGPLNEPVNKYDPDESFYNRKFTSKDFCDPDLWNQLIYEGVFEALGYSNNKEIMQKLAKAIDVKFLRKFQHMDNFEIYAESALFNIGGLIRSDYKSLDEDALLYLKTISDIWNEQKHIYDGKKFIYSAWNFAKLRPQNFPTIRLAGGARFLKMLLKDNLIHTLTEEIKTSSSTKYITKLLRNSLLIRAEGFWKYHFVLDRRCDEDLQYFIGLQRVDEIIINVILPVLSLYFEIFERKDLSERAVKVFSNYYQTNDNSLVSEVSKNLELNDAWKRSILHQGIIELFRHYCSREKCMECKIGILAFK